MKKLLIAFVTTLATCALTGDSGGNQEPTTVPPRLRPMRPTVRVRKLNPTEQKAFEAAYQEEMNKIKQQLGEVQNGVFSATQAKELRRLFSQSLTESNPQAAQAALDVGKIYNTFPDDTSHFEEQFEETFGHRASPTIGMPVGYQAP